MQLEGPPKTGPFDKVWVNWLFNLYSYVLTLTTGGTAGGTYTNGTLQSPTFTDFVDFTIPADVTEIKVMFDALDIAGQASVYVLLGTTAGFENTGYRGGTSRILSGVVSIKDTGAIRIYRGATNESVNGTLHISNMDGNTWTASGSFFSSDAGVAGFITGCAKTLSSELTRIRIQSAIPGQLFNGGSVNVKYL